MPLGHPFKLVDTSKLTQHELFSISGYTELPVGCEIFRSRGYEDNDDCYEILIRPMFIQEQMDQDLVREGQYEFWCERADEYYDQL